MAKSKTFKKTPVSSKKPLLYIQHTADPLFASKCHPSEPIIVTGSGLGLLQSYRYNVEELKEVRLDFDGLPYVISSLQQDDFLENTIDFNWSNQHHKSCRGLTFGLNLKDEIYSIGSEGKVNQIDLIKGKVISTYESPDNIKYTKCIQPPGKPYLLLGDEDGNVYCHDIKDGLKMAHKPIEDLHNGESINDICYRWPKSDYKFITLGSTSINEIDLRKPEGPITQSEDQEDEMICGTFVDQEKQDTMVCGMGEGVVTIWKPEVNKWNDQYNRIRVSKEDSIEAVVSGMDQDGRFVYAGCSDGSVTRVDVKEGRCVDHLFNKDPESSGDIVDDVTMLDLDFQYRLCVGGMDGLTLWEDEDEDGEDGDADEADDDSDDSSESSSSSPESDPNCGDDFDSDLEQTVAEPTADEEEVVARQSMKRRFDDELRDVSDSDDDLVSLPNNNNSTAPMSEVRAQLLAEISEAYKHQGEVVDITKLSKRQQKKIKVLKRPGPEHGIARFDDL